MAKEIKYNVEARELLKEGVDALCNAVKVTLGPKALRWRMSSKSCASYAASRRAHLLPCVPHSSVLTPWGAPIRGVRPSMSSMYAAI